MPSSAGILLFRRSTDIEILLVHPGGPFWATRHTGAWSIPKGEYDPDTEDAYAAARREYHEEIGRPPPMGEPVALGEVTQKAGKQVVAFALEGDVDTGAIVSNTFTVEWPPRSGRMEEFPEIDRAEWFTLDDAREAINPAQAAFVDRLVARL